MPPVLLPLLGFDELVPAVLVAPRERPLTLEPDPELPDPQAMQASAATQNVRLNARIRRTEG